MLGLYKSSMVMLASRPLSKLIIICIFISLSVKAVHLELVTELTTEASIACLKRFIPSLIWSDSGTNFIGAAQELKELYQFLQQASTQDDVMH